MEAQSTFIINKEAQSRLKRVLTCSISAHSVFALVDIILYLVLQQLRHVYLGKNNEDKSNSNPFDF